MKNLLTILTFFVIFSFSNYSHAQEPFLGEIKMFGGNFAPRGYAFCNGQLLPINQNQALFSLLGTTYGGDGRTTFALPDLRGRAAIHSGGNSQGPGLSVARLGQNKGTETNVLLPANLPAHTHQAFGVSADGNSDNPAGNYFAGTQLLDPEYSDGVGETPVSMNAGVIGNNTTTNQAVNNIQPSLGINYIIATQGVFPSRN